MPYQIVVENKILKVVFSERVVTEDLIALDKEIFEHWSDAECVGHIYDYRQVETVGFSDEEIRQIALLDKNESFVQGPLKIAIIVTEESIARYSRVYVEGLQGSDWQAAIFEDEDAANAFILT
ncbi:hypothetical protein [Planctobacterium marinum]|uniref:Uncharacterized protein n=1 Tax=Planctobacterium marinum TaxID=1631968 RepID=A0AA48HL87_9ALTE|nr:hypothetical protein MACH26_40320 [Planctobacterium marinum]